jgi:DNA polymerase-1
MVSTEQRFSIDNPCPVCHGHNALPHGTGERCYGFLSDDGSYAHCTREEYSDNCRYEEESKTYAHCLTGICHCGDAHDESLEQSEESDKGTNGHRSLEQALAALSAAATQNGSNGRVHDDAWDVQYIFDYQSSRGDLKYQIVRTKGKHIWIQHPCSDGRMVRTQGGQPKKCSCSKIPLILYRLPELLKADLDQPVFLVEGEKHVDRLISLDLAATCFPFGAKSSKLVQNISALSDRDVIILPDNDDDGQEHGQIVAHQVQGIAQSIKVLDLPNLPEKGDVLDWLDAGNTVSELLQMAADAPEWDPDPVNPAGTPPFKFLTSYDFAELVPEEVPWAIKPWLVYGSITELDGKIKWSGKTTLALAMAKSLSAGEPFLDYQPEAVHVVYLTEQNRTSFRSALGRADLLNKPNFSAATYIDTMATDWAEVVNATYEEMQRCGAKVLIVDTLPQFARLKGDAENSSGSALEAIQPLQQLAALGIAILVVRHDRKAGGDIGDSARGSSAFGGAVDIILSLRRPEGNVPSTLRVVHGIGRFDDLPDKLVIDYQDGRYISLGTEDQVNKRRAANVILDILPEEEEQAKPISLIKEDPRVKEAGAGTTLVTQVLNELVTSQQIFRKGEGVKGKPHLYWKPSADSGPDQEPNPKFILSLIGDVVEKELISADPVEEDQPSDPKVETPIKCGETKEPPTPDEGEGSPDIYSGGINIPDPSQDLDRFENWLVLEDSKSLIHSFSTTFLSRKRINNQVATPSTDRLETPARSNVPPAGRCYELVTTPAQVDSMLTELQTADVVGFDVETYGPKDIGKPSGKRFTPSGEGLVPFKGKIRLAQFSTGDRTWVVDCHQVDLSLLRSALESGPIKIIHSAAFELAFVRQALGVVIYPVVDTRLMSRLLRTKVTDRHRLEDVVSVYLGITLDKTNQKSNWSGELSPEQLLYAARDAQVLPQLYQVLLAEIEAKGLEYVYDLEHQFLPECADMEHRGVKWDRQLWQGLEEERKDELARLTTRLNQELDQHLSAEAVDQALSGIKSRKPGTPINWNSPDQLKPLLLVLGVEVSDCGIDTLQQAAVKKDAHSIMKHRLPVRELLGFPGALALKKLDTQVAPDGKFHPKWQQLGARTGRMSCQEPPLQQIPSDAKIRQGFIPSPGYCFGVLDLSQIESRVLAEVTQDPSMVQALLDGLDLHRWVAATLLDQPYEDIPPKGKERNWGKAMNLAISYGYGKEALALSMSLALGRPVSASEATQRLEQYFQAFPGVKAWQEQQEALLQPTGRKLKDKKRGGTYEEKVGETTTVLGRRCLATTKSQALNFPIQGSAADAFKESVVILRQTQAESGGAHLVMLVHDEFIIEIPDDPESIAKAKQWLLHGAVTGTEKVLKTVPVGVTEKNIAIGHYWVKPD